MKLKNKDAKLLAEAYAQINEVAPLVATAARAIAPSVAGAVMSKKEESADVSSTKILPKIGEIVTKKEAQENDRKEYVVVGIEPQGIWIYPLGNTDFASTKAELVFTKEINF
jgi:hypothetical protein